MDGLKTLRSRLRGIWQTDQPLPPRATLRTLAGLICDAWDEGALARRIRTDYNARLTTTLGRAIYDDLRVELNPRLLGEHPDQLLPTLAHELAHLVVHERYGRCRPHGREFRTLMRAINLSPKATHDLPVEHVRRRRGKFLYLHRCDDCGRSFVASRRRNDCFCRYCGPGMHWDVFRLPNTQAGRNLLDRLMHTRSAET